MKNNFVLRLKGFTKGHIFYDYLEPDYLNGGSVIGCEKFKYAWEFDSYEEAKGFKAEHDKNEEFDVVSYNVAEEDYYAK